MKYVRTLVMVGAAALPAAAARAVEPPGKMGKVTHRRETRVVGREEGNNAFRNPGSILAAAKKPPRRVDPGQLAARYKAMYGGRSFTSSLPSVQPAEGDAPASVPRQSRVPPAAATGGGLTTVYYAAFAAAVVLLLVLVGWAVTRRRAATAMATSAARSRRKRASWADRDMEITMGGGDD